MNVDFVDDMPLMKAWMGQHLAQKHQEEVEEVLYRLHRRNYKTKPETANVSLGLGSRRVATVRPRSKQRG